MLTADAAATALLKFNYLPRQRKSADELPALFTSRDIDINLVNQLAGAPNSNPRPGYDAVDIGQTRADGRLRVSSVPHPCAYLKLVELIRINWVSLQHLEQNTPSRIRPHAHKDGRIIVMNYGDWKSKNIGHIRTSFGATILVKADIANFFGSIYTHSIPWAAVGIRLAKSTIGQTHWYNQMDDALQFCKRRETNGIAVGPGSSNIFAELLLSKVDAALSKFLFHRFIDDYTAFCGSNAEADEFIRTLENELAKFKLVLNHGKTRYEPLPQAISPNWVLEIRRKVRALPETVRPAQAVDFIDFSLNLAVDSGEQSTLKYAFRALAACKRHYWTDSVILEYGLLLATRYPAIFPALNPFVQKGAARSGPLVTREKLFAVLSDSLARGRTDLACWAVFFANSIGAALPDDTIKEAVTSLDCLAMLSCFRFANTTQKKTLAQFANRIVAAPDMHDRHRYWLLLYELYRTGHVKSAGDETGVYRILAANGVKFVPSLT